MNSRERVIRTLNFQEPDRVPLDLGSTVTTIHTISHQNLKKHLGYTGGEEIIIDRLQQVVSPDERILKRFDIDVRHVSTRPAVPWQEIKPGVFRDEWGMEYEAKSGYFEMTKHPLAEVETLADLEKYKWPDPLDERRYEGLEDGVDELANHSPYAIMLGGFSESFFGLPSWLMGHEKFFFNLLANPQLVEAVLDGLEQFFLPLADEMLKRVGDKVEVIKVADDLGTQSGLLVSPDLYRSVIKPRQARLYQRIKELSSAKIFMHTCGAIRPLIPDLIEIGVDALNPVQVSAVDMNPASLKQEFGNRIAFWGGGCDTQKVLPFGSVQEVEEEVKLRIKQLAPGGGFVFTGVHNIQYDVPPENIIALYESAKKFGVY